MITASGYTRQMTPSERFPSLQKRSSMGGDAPSFRRYPSTPRISTAYGSSPDRTIHKRYACVTKKVLEKTQAKAKISELEALLKQICQSGFDEAYIYNEETQAKTLADEFVRNLKQALTKLIDRFRSRYVKARRATLDMFQTSDDLSTRFEKTSRRNPHTSTETLPLTINGAETEDSITTATSNFFGPATTRSAQKPKRVFGTPSHSHVKSGFTVSPKQSQTDVVEAPTIRFTSATPEPKQLEDSTPAASVKEVSIQTSSAQAAGASLSIPRQTQPNFFMNTIAYDVHLYMRMLYLHKKGNIEGAQVISELFTNPLKDIQEAVHPQILSKGASVSPRQQQLWDYDSEITYRPGVKFSLDPRYINFASKAVSPGPAVHNRHEAWKLRPGSVFTKDKTEFNLELPSADNPGPSYYRPSRGKCSYGSIPKLLRRGGVSSRSPR